MLTKVVQVQTQDREINQVQFNLARSVNPVLQNPIVDGLLLQDVALVTGDNTINHRLARNLIGWIIVSINDVSSIYDKQATNQLKASTLVLHSSADVTVSIYVF